MGDPPSFRRMLKDYRKAHDLTQEQLAEQVSCSVETIKKIEAGKLRPGKQLAELLADRLALLPENRVAFLKAARAEVAPPQRNLPSPASTFQPDFPAMPPDHNRSRMLAKVRTFWVKGVLGRSLYNAALIPLSMEYRPDAVTRPWDTLVQQPDQPVRLLPPDTPIAEVFDEMGGEILILGGLGSGKTTVLLELARDLIARAETNKSQPIPAVFSLTSWTIRRGSIAAWLVDELNERYSIPRKIGQAWVDTDEILPLLDCLNEVKLEHRTACVEALNHFRHEHGLVGMVVCSRHTDYEILTSKLRLQSAVVLQPLTSLQIDTYLAQAGDQLRAAREILQVDATLRKLVETPLVLSILTQNYQGKQAEQIYDLREHLHQIHAQLHGISEPSSAISSDFSPVGDIASSVKQIEIVLKGNFDNFTPDIQGATIRAVAAIINIAPHQVVVLKVTPGSIVLLIELPQEAADRLLDLYQSHDPYLKELGIEAIHPVQNVQTMSLSALIQKALEERERVLDGERPDTAFAYELFKRAVVDKDPIAWKAIRNIYLDTVKQWISSNALLTDKSTTNIDDLTQFVFDRFKMAISPRRFVQFNNLYHITSYLSAIAKTVVIDIVRATQGTKHRPIRFPSNASGSQPQPDVGEGAHFLAEHISEFWDLINSMFQDDQERVVLFSTFILDVQPRDIYQQRPDLFNSVKDVYTTKRRVLQQLKQHPEIWEYLKDSRLA
jgi:transcriptional regulator with XRE-family HTH domain